MRAYEPSDIEKKWQDAWAQEGVLRKADDTSASKKTYLLVEFPFPSGEGLHIGHPRSYVALDIAARKRRAQGENVLFPMGWDAFGLPTENYAIKTGRNPKDVTRENTDNFRRQMKMLGLSFDWSREVNTTDPSYYKWTQWIFIQLYKHGLAYKSKTVINWCPKCKIGLANEEVVGGECERCGSPVEKREREQWMLAITKYAQRLYDDLDSVDFIEAAKAGQRNWIGPSHGAEIDFAIEGGDERVRVFTTRPDTLFGATYLVLAPEHDLVSALLPRLSNAADVEAYVTNARKKTDIERVAEGKEKTGVILEGIRATNPATSQSIPVYIADYVLATYGTGAIMAVPAHDERDFEFAMKFNLPVLQVVEGGDMPFSGEGTLTNSGTFNGMSSEEARRAITEAVGGEMKTTYKLRDWVFSRQRYWGEPIPMIHCEKCGWVPVPETNLPVTLPDVEKYEPTETGDSPLASMDAWVNVACPTCGGDAKRETDVMPNWAGSSWYYLRYCDPHNDEVLASPEKLKYWLPVDWYNGGMEHTTLHLLYSRFWHKFLYDIHVVPTAEPYTYRTSHGFILAENGEKMSKSRGNVINPDEMVERFGADTFRTYEMFMGPFDQAIAWSTNGMVGVRRFLERVWKLRDAVTDSAVLDPKVHRLLNETVRKVGDDIEALKFNTAVSSLMILAGALEEAPAVPVHGYETLLVLLAPFAPHMTQELWMDLGRDGMVADESWPEYDETLGQDAEATVVIQVAGRVRGSVTVPRGASSDAVLEAALAVPGVKKWVGEVPPARVVLVPDKLINIVPGELDG